MHPYSIVYITKTGHSRKLARAIGSKLGVEPRDIASAPQGTETSLLLIVGGIYGGESLPALLEYVQRLDPKRIGRAALVTSCTSKRKGQDAVRRILMDKGIPVAGEYLCYGSFLFVKLGHPNAAEIRGAVQFAADLCNKT